MIVVAFEWDRCYIVLWFGILSCREISHETDPNVRWIREYVVAEGKVRKDWISTSVYELKLIEHEGTIRMRTNELTGTGSDSCIVERNVRNPR